ncbi:nicotinate (nicotinamide) nucleotide adenylyltransferase [Treponema pectinovorum]|uniref:nicotinate (nicotinamide) nucleotide adenylyltransferase n=1 Tax=Treponema pectinovorum TaxID=164 RepID=UPI0011CB478F|nr:nicotinate (nicotinamide) nucleotide adenylyltransferase [Treponema pectinovorum]
MKIAILGGSFNPIHIGHLILADSVCTELGYDKVLFVPCFEPPHKKMADAASAFDRLQMVKLAVKSDVRFEAEDFEIKNGGISYTCDTVFALEQKYADVLSAKMGLILGFDLASHFEDWKNAKLLSQTCELILAVRENENLKNSSKNQAKGEYAIERVDFSIEKFSFPHVDLHNPSIILSSSDIRDRILESKSWRYLVSPEVFEYIKERNLYGFKSDQFK